MDAMVEALMPFVMFAAVLWGIEAIVTMLIRDHKKAKRKQVLITPILLRRSTCRCYTVPRLADTCRCGNR